MSQLNRSFKITFVYFPSGYGLPYEGIEERGGENGGKGEEEKEQQKSSFSIVLYQLFRIIFYIDNIIC